MQKWTLFVVSGFLVLVAPALAGRPQPGLCVAYVRNYDAHGTLIRAVLTPHGRRGYSGKVKVNVVAANHSAMKGNQTFTLIDAKIHFGAGVEATNPTPGSRVRLGGRITQRPKLCRTATSQPTITIKRVKIRAAETPFRFFSPSSFWNLSLAPKTPLDPHSGSITERFDEEVARELQARDGPWINTTSYSVPIYTVSVDQPTVPVKLISQFPAPALRSAWKAVPLPSSAKPAPGTDGHLVVWQPGTDRLWEFWRLEHEVHGWQAAWGGAMQDVSSNQGVYGAGAWPGATRSWGASGSSLSIAGGLITLEDLQDGQINHALAVAIPNVRAGVYASPAQRDDGHSTDPLSLPEGAHLRLDPKLDLAALHLPRLTLLIAQAAQRYGLFVIDGGSNITFFAQDPSSTGSNPYTGQEGYFEGMSPSQLLASFPWRHLELLKMDLHADS